MVEDERTTWEAALRETLQHGGLIQRIEVADEVDSTQDDARRRGVPTGTLVTALRQRKGRGRLGRQWHDTGRDGVAVTAVLEGDDPPRLSLRCALACALAIESVMHCRVGI